MAQATNRVELTIATAIGPIRLQADGQGLIRVVLPGSKESKTTTARQAATEHPLLAKAAQQIREYLAGERTAFDLPLSPRGTPFQLRVWEIIRQIPYGQTMTYGAIASLLGDRAKAPAVGGAAHANPLPLVIPCHRIIGAGGSLTGFACGLAMKEGLLRREGVLTS